mgnify:FL=1
MSKTPKFDAAIAIILKDLSPQDKICRQCDTPFHIFQEDIDFYKIFKVPPPTFCPDCRMQRRLSYRVNFLPVFYKRDCSAPGHKEKIISFYSNKNPTKVYDDEYYLSDSWDDLEFGLSYDSKKSFFNQFQTLSNNVPHQSLHKDPASVNSDYVVTGVSAKNCYYVAAPVHSEDIQYGSLPAYSRNCIDVIQAYNSENCFNCVHIDRCANCNYCYESSNCLDCNFLFDCKNCTNCFGCSNLRNKSYCFFNQQLTKEEYQEKMSQINFGDRDIAKKYSDLFEKEVFVV